jgi:hypothetical protein
MPFVVTVGRLAGQEETAPASICPVQVRLPPLTEAPKRSHYSPDGTRVTMCPDDG